MQAPSPGIEQSLNDSMVPHEFDTAQNPIADPKPQRQSNADPDPGTRPPYKKGFGDDKYDIFSILLSDCGRLYDFIFVSSYTILKTLDPDPLFDYGSGSRRKIGCRPIIRIRNAVQGGFSLVH